VLFTQLLIITMLVLADLAILKEDVL